MRLVLIGSAWILLACGGRALVDVPGSGGSTSVSTSKTGGGGVGGAMSSTGTSSSSSSTSSGSSTFSSSSSSTSSSATSLGCTQDSDCGDAGPCNTCRPGPQLCLAPLAPVAALKAGACKKLLAPCTAPTMATCGPVGTFPVGSQPWGIAFDSTNMWVTIRNNSAAKLSPSGATLGAFAAGSNPFGIAFDGTNLWVTNSRDNTVTKL